MAKTMGTLTMDELITGLGDIRATTKGKGQDVCQAAVNILFALSEEGARTAEEALDILHDYRLQAKQDEALRQKHIIAGKPHMNAAPVIRSTASSSPTTDARLLGGFICRSPSCLQLSNQKTMRISASLEVSSSSRSIQNTSRLRSLRAAISSSKQ